MPLNSWNPYYLTLFHGADVFGATFGSFEIEGDENIPATGCVFAANHASHLDPPLMGAAIPREVHALARKTLFDNPVVGRLIGGANSIPVDLSKPADLGAIKRLTTVAQSGGSILIFPEGTRSLDGNIAEPKAGTGMLACRMALTVVPARIFGAFEMLPRSALSPVVGTRLSVVFGKPLAPGDFDPGNKHPDRYLEAARRIMAAIAAIEAPPQCIA